MDAGGLGAPPAETAKPHTGGAATAPKEEGRGVLICNDF